MPAPEKQLTLESARELVRERSFRRSTGNLVGIELEWFTAPSHDPPDVRTLRRILQDAPVMPHGSSITFEPGAQVELSTPALHGVDAASDAIVADAEVVLGHLGSRGIDTFAAGMDPDRSLALRTDEPRYVAMRRYFDPFGPAAGRMMCASAAIHVNLDAGADAEGTARWRAAHVIGPTLVAAFANSPMSEGRITGWKSSRWRAWQQLDPTRTDPVPHDPEPGEAWASYALDARVMFVRRGAVYTALREPMTFADWIREGHRLGYPDAGDLLYHLTTLFPPMRPRGYLEIRMIDMLPGPWWRAAVAVTAALVCDAAAREAALAACAASAGMWTRAARCGLEDPVLAASARDCFAAAEDALRRRRSASSAAVGAYADRYVRNAACPADDVLSSAPIAEVM